MWADRGQWIVNKGCVQTHVYAQHGSGHRESRNCVLIWGLLLQHPREPLPPGMFQNCLWLPKCEVRRSATREPSMSVNCGHFLSPLLEPSALNIGHAVTGVEVQPRWSLQNTDQASSNCLIRKHSAEDPGPASAPLPASHTTPAPPSPWPQEGKRSLPSLKHRLVTVSVGARQ